jgi:hypothetical protein
MKSNRHSKTTSRATQMPSTLIGSLSFLLMHVAMANDFIAAETITAGADLFFVNGFETPAGSTADVLCPFSGTYTGTFGSAGSLTANGAWTPDFCQLVRKLQV